jgi:hypothetical protein
LLALPRAARRDLGGAEEEGRRVRGRLAALLVLVSGALTQIQDAAADLLVPPKRITRTVHFRPARRACCAALARIAQMERRAQGGPSILGRLACESTMGLDNHNGQYKGPSQIGPDFWRSAWPRTPRGVRYVTERLRRVPVLELGGTIGPHVVGTRSQRVRVIHRGRLPAGAGPLHAWANVRVAQRAAAGYAPQEGASWSCGL